MSSSCPEQRVCTPITVTSEGNTYVSSSQMYTGNTFSTAKSVFFSDPQCQKPISSDTSVQGLPLWTFTKNQNVYACLWDVTKSNSSDTFYTYSYVLASPQSYNVTTIQHQI